MNETEVRELLAKPTISPDELFRSRIFPLSRNGVYDAIKRGDIAALAFGKKRAILTAPLRAKLGMEAGK